MPTNHASKAHGFAMRSMSLRDMQLSESEKIILGPPCQILATPMVCVSLLLACVCDYSSYVSFIVFVQKMLSLECTKSFNNPYRQILDDMWLWC